MLWVLVVAAALIAAIAARVASRPNTIAVRRELAIRAPAQRVFDLLDDFHQWPLWAPHDRMDSSMRRTYDGPARGRGAQSGWTSTGRAGTGRMEITESVPGASVTVEVDFVRPFVAHNVNQFILLPDGDGVLVSWTLRGPRTFPMKLMSAFVDLEKMTCGHFDAGLQSLRALCESPA